MVKREKSPEGETIPWKCAVCNSCRLVVSGTYGCAGPRQCIYGGPFKGYQEVDILSGYPPLTCEEKERDVWKHYRTDVENAPKDKYIMGRIACSNRAVAVRWCADRNSFVGVEGKPVEIIQWQTFTVVADIQSCMWRSDPR